MLPGQLPKWRTVHACLAKWSELDQGGVGVPCADWVTVGVKK